MIRVLDKPVAMRKIQDKTLFSSKILATIYLVMMNVQLVAFEGSGVSSFKVGLMALALPILLSKKLYFERVFLWGIAYWLVVFLITFFKDDMRFSTIGYLGMFIVTFIMYYCLIYSGAFSLNYFMDILRWLIMAYCIVLVLQQLAMLVGLRSLWFINLYNQGFLSLDKLPSLSIEPSHSARLLTALMFSYIRSLETLKGKRINFRVLYNKKNRIISILFLWSMLTMGSGTAFIGLGILSLYFIQRKTVFYVIPILFILFFIGQSMEFEQMNRAVSIVESTITGDIEIIDATDGSAADRIMPIINTFSSDLSDITSWVGKGTYSEDFQKIKWTFIDTKIDIVEQYGLIGLILSLILIYTCIIRNFFSIESVIFLLLCGVSLSNIYYIWGIVMLFTTVRYFQLKLKNVVIGTRRKQL